MFSRLTHQQKSIMQWIMDRFKENGEWPTFHQVERAFVKRIDGDVGDVVASMFSIHREGRRYLSYDRDRSVPLTPAMMVRCDGVEEALAPLMDALPIILSIYENTDGKPEVRHADFLSHGWSQERTQTLGRVLGNTRLPFIHGTSGHTSGFDTWHHGEIQSNIRSYAKCRSAREYLGLLAKQERRHNRRWRKHNRRVNRNMDADPDGPRGMDRVLWWIVVPLTIAVVGGWIVTRLN